MDVVAALRREAEGDREVMEKVRGAAEHTDPFVFGCIDGRERWHGLASDSVIQVGRVARAPSRHAMQNVTRCFHRRHCAGRQGVCLLCPRLQGARVQVHLPAGGPARGAPGELACFSLNSCGDEMPPRFGVLLALTWSTPGLQAILCVSCDFVIRNVNHESCCTLLCQLSSCHHVEQAPDCVTTRLPQATAFGVLRLPKMAETKKAKGASEFVVSEVDPDSVKFKDKARCGALQRD